MRIPTGGVRAFHEAIARAVYGVGMMKPANPFRYFNSLPEGIGLVVMMYIRRPLWLGIVEGLLFERGIGISLMPLSPSVNLA